MIIILLLIMLVVLSVGIAITQRSTTDISTSTQSEQSSQAFSAAEAGIEQALQNKIPLTVIPLGNSSEYKVTTPGLLPKGGTGLGIEYPPIGKETTAQFWLTDPDSAKAYTKNSFEIWFGNADKPFNTTDNIPPAIEVTVVSLAGGEYKSYRYYFDSDPNRISQNNFSGCIPSQILERFTILNSKSKFYCRATVSGYQAPASLVRVRILYSNLNQKVALLPTQNGSFPPQIELYNSIGKAGQSQVALQVFKALDLVPAWFDFAIFSVNTISK